MSLITAIRDYLRPPELRTLTPTQVWGRGGDWYPLSGSGISVTAEMAMQAASGACVRLIADDISSLPVDVIRKVDGVAQESNRPSWLEYPTAHRWDSFQSYISDVVVSMLTDGNAFVECIPDAFSPSFFSVKDPEPIQIYSEAGKVTYRSGAATWSEAEMMHIPWVRMPGKLRGLSVIDAAKESTGLELAAREWAGAFFRNGGTLGTVIEHPGKPSPEEMDILRNSFNERHQGSSNAWKMGIVTGGAKLASERIAPNDAALEPLWKHVLEEAARLYHIPPHMLGSQDPGGSSYSSVEQRAIEYVQHAIVPVVTRIEAAHNRFLGRGRSIKLNVNALLRGDVKTRAAFYQMALTNKVMRPSEVRDKEDLPFDAENTGYLQTPNNNAPEDYGPQTEGDDPNAAGLTFAPELRIDSLAVSEEGVTRIAQASTDGIATGVAVLGDSLTRTFTDAIDAVKAQSEAEAAELRAQIEALEERERIRSLPVSIRIRDGKVYEQRGEEVTVKSIQRDETGKVVGLVAEA